VNYAIIIAGGIGKRMQHEIPKQFIHVFDKPVLLYTLENFQRHPQIDAIEVVCVTGWEDVVWAYAKQYGITKLKWVIKGGDTAQDSIKNGVFNLENCVSEEDIVVIHDGIRPLIEPEVLTDVLKVAMEYGNAVTSLPYNEQIFVVNDDDIKTTNRFIPRETLRRVSTPQAYQFGILAKRYHEAYEKKIGIYGSSYANTMMVELGETLHFAAGSEKNIKLTTKDDLELFKGYILNNIEKTTLGINT
jgi:2-C-methyl-D-erythritol 4-phosphate cytidylyltransferase